MRGEVGKKTPKNEMDFLCVAHDTFRSSLHDIVIQCNEKEWLDGNFLKVPSEHMKPYFPYV